MLTLTSTRELLAMGVRCRIDIASPHAPLLIDDSVRLLNELERLWSRFIPSSDICRINRAHGNKINVDPRTVSLIAAMKEAHSVTNGTFNPCLLPEQVSLGDAASLQNPGMTVIPEDSVIFHSLDKITFLDSHTVSLPQRMTLDAGGIAKGYAADIIAQHAVDNGATFISVNLGGDIRVAQQMSSTADLPVDVVHPLKSNDVISTVSLKHGAIATSARNARWRHEKGIPNHIMGTATDIIGASVIASTGLWADTWTKHLIISPNGLKDIDSVGLAGLIVCSDGSVEKSQRWKEFEKC